MFGNIVVSSFLYYDEQSLNKRIGTSVASVPVYVLALPTDVALHDFKTSINHTQFCLYRSPRDVACFGPKPGISLTRIRAAV